MRSADSWRRVVRTEDRDLALPPFASTKWIRNRATDCSDAGDTGRFADSAKAAYLRASRHLARALLEEAIADFRIENLESAVERDEGGGSESSGGVRTELPSGGSVLSVDTASAAKELGCGGGSGSSEDSGGGRLSQSAKTGPPLQTETRRAGAAGMML